MKILDERSKKWKGSIKFIIYISMLLKSNIMKFILPVLACFFLFSTTSIQAQETYIVDGETYSLKSDVKGEIELLWNVIDEQYRYFLKKGDYIAELKNTKQNGKFQQEYKQILAAQTAEANISTKNVNLTLPSLNSFFSEYNSLKDSSFSNAQTNVQLQLLLGGYLGVTNSIYTANITNEAQAVLGLELELVDPIKLKRHAAVLDLKHTFEGSDNIYSATQFSLNYRFKFIKTAKLDVYANAKFFAFTFFDTEVGYLDGGVPKVRTDSGSDFSSPLTFGIGADYRIGNGYITFAYRDVVGINVDSNKEFPIDFSLGYKFRL